MKYKTTLQVKSSFFIQKYNTTIWGGIIMSQS